MASTAQEAAFLDGTHPALSGNASAMENLRSSSPARSSSPTSSRSSSPNPNGSGSRFNALDSSPPPPASSFPTPNKPTPGGGASNTGPKGVLADYQARKNNNSGTSLNTGPKGVLSDYQGSQLAAAQSAMGNLNLSPRFTKSAQEERDEEQDELDEVELMGGLGGDEDARAIETYRRKRLLEMSGSGERGGAKKVFGHLREIGMDQFLSAVDEVDDETAVVLHLYEPDIEACYVLNNHLSSLARAYPYTKFIRALATEVDFAADSEDEALPTVLVYRGGELETTLVRLDRDWGKGTRQDVLDLLIQSGAVSGTPTEAFRGRENPPSSSDDSD